jgi:hypothetical protein
MANDTSQTDRIRDWFEHSPKAQRAYRRLSADLDAVVAWVESATSGLRERAAPIIDPVRPAPAPEPVPDPASEPGLTPAEQAVLEGEQATSEARPEEPGPDGPKPDEGPRQV